MKEQIPGNSSTTKYFTNNNKHHKWLTPALYSTSIRSNAQYKLRLTIVLALANCFDKANDTK